MTLPASDSVLFLCKRTTIDVHVIGETPELLADRQKEAMDIVEKYAKTGQEPGSWPEGVEIKISVLYNHGGGGGP